MLQHMCQHIFRYLELPTADNSPVGFCFVLNLLSFFVSNLFSFEARVCSFMMQKTQWCPAISNEDSEV